MNNSSANGLGAYIKYLRLKANLSQKELAEKTELSTSEISKLENGDRQKPSIKYLKRIAPVLEVPVQELLYRAGYIDDVWDDKAFPKSTSFTDSMGNPIDMSFVINSIYEADVDLLPLLKSLVVRYNEDDVRIVKGVLKALTAEAFSKEEKNALLIILSKFLRVV